MWSWTLSSFSPHPLLSSYSLYSDHPAHALLSLCTCGCTVDQSFPDGLIVPVLTSFWALLRCHIHWVFLWHPIQTHKCSISSCPVIRLSSLERNRHRHGVWDARCLRGINASAEMRVEAGLREEMELWFVELGNQYWPSEMAWGPIWQGFYSLSCLVLCGGCPRNTGRHLFAAEAGP